MSSGPSKTGLKATEWICLALTISWTELKLEEIVRPGLIAIGSDGYIRNDNDNPAWKSDKMIHSPTHRLL